MARLKGGITIDPSFFRQIEEFIQDNKNSVKNFKFGMDAAVMLYAYTTLAEAQKRSLGPLDPRMVGKRMTGHRFIGSSSGDVRRQPLYTSTAWKIPVRRISGAYFSGWFVKRVSLGVWMLSNNSREAYFIEFGINHAGTGLHDSAGNRVRIRRPILKLSVLAAYNFAASTNFDLVAFKGIFTSTYHSPHLYDPPTHRSSYNMSSGLEGQLRNMASSMSREQTGALMKSNSAWWSAASSRASK